MSITPRRVLAGAALCALIFSWSTFVNSALAAGPGGGCTFDVECDDGNPCTEDRCLFDPGAVPGSGTCDHDALPAGAAGECDDGVFCNGAEVCDGGGQCVSGPAATCCNLFGEDYCSENLGRCTEDSLRPGEHCATDTECGGGQCAHCRLPCENDADCSDGLGCNGTETCVSGQCVAGIPPCGVGAFCSEKRCIGQAPAKACLTNQDCNQGIPCNNSAGPLCYRGRCCTNVVTPVCEVRFLNLGPASQTCQGTGGKFFPGDNGLDTGMCGGADPNEPGAALGCPRYSSGIEQLSVNAPPAHPVSAGPVSGSPQPVIAPNGPGTPLYRLGDDYAVSDGSHLQLKAFRFVATLSGYGSVKFDFLDDSGELVGGVTTDVLGGTGVRVAYVDPPLIIPPSGYIAASITNASPNAEFTWQSASAATTGANDPDSLLVNDAPGAANFMAPAPGILSFELLGPPVAAPLGACCTGAGECSELTRWVCTRQGGHFQGVGSVCPSAACDAGACCDATTGECNLTFEMDCTGDFQGIGTNCEPNCCPQPATDTDCSDGACYSGADDCAEATVHSIPALSPGSPAHVVTITGDSTFASSTESEPDSCFGESATLTSDAGWFESFHLTGECTTVRIDACCSNPNRPELHPWITTACNCQNLIPARAKLDVDALPHCADGNAWAEFGPLGPADYFIPIPSALVDPHGPYQMHITATACQEAACCLADGSCAGPMDQLTCEAQGGAWLGRPVMPNPVEDCTESPCATGSCCTSDNQCQDEIGGVPIDKPTCDGLSGTFTGGLRCQVGTCAADADYSCNDDDDCVAAGGGTCPLPPGTQIPAEPTPCPLCEFESPANCQMWDDPDEYRYSFAELSYGSGMITADDFVAGAGLSQIDELCVWGVYLITDPDSETTDCGETRTADNFRVRVLPSDQYGLPDATAPVGSSSATAERRLIAGANSETVFDPPMATYQIHLTLADPITGLEPGEIYWLEVSNHLAEADECVWLWSQISDSSTQGNRFLMRGSDANGYIAGAEDDADQAFCLPGVVETPPTYSRPCCGCAGDCTNENLAGCRAHHGEFDATAVDINGAEQSCSDDYACPTETLPANDECAGAIEVGVGTHPFSIHCSTTDFATQVVMTDFGLDPSNLEVWFEFVAPQDCLLRVDMCATGADFDSMLALYSSGTEACICPTQDHTTEPTWIDTDDESCAISNLGAGGSGYIEASAQAGQCFIIRVGNWGPGGTRGTGVLDISCGPAVCGDNAAQAVLNEECDGTDDAACPGLCRPPGDAQECTCGPPPECGNNVREGSETCDGTDSAQCPGFCPPPGFPGECMCMSECGDGVRAGVEECDGPADTSCGGAAGRCQSDCTCPPVVCGNDYKDPAEECDGTDDDLCPGECREPGDPAGECTCRCMLPDPDPLLPESPPFNKVRHISFVVPSGAFGDTALRVELISLHHPSNPPPGTPDFSEHEGTFRYVNSFGGSTTCVDSATFGTNSRCGQLGCQPEYRDWYATLSNATNPASPAGLIHVTGDAVVPSSTVAVSQIHLSCGAAPGADTCLLATTALMLNTSRWGDVGGGGGGPSDGAANVIDCGLVVDKVKGQLTALPERRAWLKSPPNPLGNAINVIDVGLSVDATKGLPYPYSIAACP